jgi:energy-coupling factor transport system substrate-specific component
MSLLVPGQRGKFVLVSELLCVGFGIAMILSTSASLAYFAGLDYWWCVMWIGIADVVPIALCPFVVMWLAPKIQNLRGQIPWI